MSNNVKFEGKERRLAGIEACLAEYGIKAALVSNNHEPRVKEFNPSLGLLAFWDSGQPGKKTLIKAMTLLGVTDRETAMLGDQLHTDSYAGKHIGLPTIIVPPIKDKTNLFFRFKRLCERPFIRKYAKMHGWQEWMLFWKIRESRKG